jgi:hypothetical protein
VPPFERSIPQVPQKEVRAHCLWPAGTGRLGTREQSDEDGTRRCLADQRRRERNHCVAVEVRQRRRPRQSEGALRFMARIGFIARAGTTSRRSLPVCARSRRLRPRRSAPAMMVAMAARSVGAGRLPRGGSRRSCSWCGMGVMRATTCDRVPPHGGSRHQADEQAPHRGKTPESRRSVKKLLAATCKFYKMNFDWGGQEHIPCHQEIGQGSRR